MEIAANHGSIARISGRWVFAIDFSQFATSRLPNHGEFGTLEDLGWDNPTANAQRDEAFAHLCSACADMLTARTRGVADLPSLSTAALAGRFDPSSLLR